MNTTFFERAADIHGNFSWKDIFSDAIKPHGRKELNQLLTKGIGENVPAPGQMLEIWQKPWLFFRVALAGIALSLLILASWNIFSSTAMGVMLFMIPSFVLPLAAAVFFWEMNIPGNVSLYEMLLLVLLGGVLSLTVTGVVRNLFDMPDAAFLVGPLPEEAAKLAIVYLLLKRNKYRCGLQGILIGGAVGVGFSAMESAGYAWDNFTSAIMTAQEFSIVTDSVTDVIVARSLLSPGGHVVWAALYGGALGLAMGRNGGTIRLGLLTDKLVIASWSGAFLLHTAWNFDPLYFYGLLPESWIVFFLRLQAMYINYILLIVLGWAFLLFIMRKSIVQVIEANRGAAAARRPAASPGVAKSLTVKALSGPLAGRQFTVGSSGSLTFGRSKANQVCFPADTKGVSSVHCEIQFRNGSPVLIDRNSTYGTFLDSGKKLEPNAGVRLENHGRFYLGGKSNLFSVSF